MLDYPGVFSRSLDVAELVVAQDRALERGTCAVTTGGSEDRCRERTRLGSVLRERSRRHDEWIRMHAFQKLPSHGGIIDPARRFLHDFARPLHR